MDRDLLIWAIGVGDPDEPEKVADKLIVLMQRQCEHKWAVWLDIGRMEVFCAHCGKEKS